MSNDSSRLKKVCKEIKANHLRFKWKMPSRGKWTRRNELLQMMYSLYADIIMVNERLIATQTEYRTLEAKDRAEGLSDTKIKREFELLRLFELDVKHLYNLVYAVHHCLSKSFIAEKIELEELHRITMFRHLYLFHYPPIKSRKKAQRPIRSFNRGFAIDIENYEIFYLPPKRTKRHFSGIVRLKNNASKYIAELNDVAKDDYPAIIRLLYRNLNKIKNRRIRRTTMKFLENKGIVSDTPVHILTTLCNILVDTLRIMKVDRTK